MYKIDLEKERKKDTGVHKEKERRTVHMKIRNVVE